LYTIQSITAMQNYDNNHDDFCNNGNENKKANYTAVIQSITETQHTM